MRSSWPSRVLLPATQALAEGSWVAVTYAAMQAIAGEAARMGPIELGVLAWAGMAWGRRARWRSASAEALGLPLLALVAGLAGWLLDPQVRALLIAGDPLGALATHVPGWVAAVAFWRGEVHRSAEDDDAIQDRLLRWGVPGLALPWAVGHLVADGVLEREFTAAAFVATVFFAASAFTAMGLARLEAVRASTGSDWRANRSWVALVIGIGVITTLLSIPAAAVLDVPARSLLVAILLPLQAAFLVLLLAATPIIIVAAAVAEVIGPMLPEGFGLGEIQLPDFSQDTRELTNRLPVIVFYVAIGLLLLLELIVVGAVLWLRWQERRRMRMALADPFEERSIVIPPPEESLAPRAPRPRRRRRREADPTAAYLAALESLDRDGRWPRRPEETPAAHAARVRAAGLEGASLGRLAAAYQLIRYGARRIGAPERGRAAPRLAALRRALRG